MAKIFISYKRNIEPDTPVATAVYEALRQEHDVFIDTTIQVGEKWAERIQKGIDMNAGNAVLVKMNQIGTLSETVKAMDMAKKAGFKTVISARSGETEDATLADLAVGLNSEQIKIGSFAGSSRLAKYNQLLRINEQLGGKYAGKSVFKFQKSN